MCTVSITVSGGYMWELSIQNEYLQWRRNEFESGGGVTGQAQSA